MTNRFLFPVFLSLCISSVVQGNFLDSLEDSLQSAWHSICGIAKTEGENAGDLTARGTGLVAGVLDFWQKHPKIFKTLVGSAAVVGAVRAQQYISVREHLDKARVFCTPTVPGAGEPRPKHGWISYDPGRGRAGEQLRYCNELKTNLASSSWLRVWLHELGRAEFVEFNVDNPDHVYWLLERQGIKEEIIRRADALGTPQYYSWFDTYAVWKSRVCSVWNKRNEVGVCTSLATALFTPYDGEATKLMLKLVEAEIEMNRPHAWAR